MSKKESWFDDAGSTSLELWSSVASTLCMCVNNPQNEENQKVCGFVLPYMFQVLEGYRNPLVARSLISLIGFVVSNNSLNQDQVRRCGGLNILIKCLKHLVKQGQKSTESAHLAIQITSTIDSCITDNIENCKEIGSQGAMKLMLDLLNTECLDDAAKLQLVVTLGHAVESCDINKKEISEENSLTRLIQHLTDTEDEELSKAVKYLLQICVSNKVSNPEKENLASPNRNEIMHMQSELVLLQKINEITERLKSIEQQSVQDTQKLVDVSKFTLAPNTERDHSNSLVSTAVCLTPREKGLLSELYKERKERQRLELITKQHLQTANKNLNQSNSDYYMADVAENDFVKSHQNALNAEINYLQNPLQNRDIYMPDCSGDYISKQKENSTRDFNCTDPRLNHLQMSGIHCNGNTLFLNRHDEHNLSNFCGQGNEEEYCSNLKTIRMNDSGKDIDYTQNLNRIFTKDSTRKENFERTIDRNQHLFCDSSLLQQNEINQNQNQPDSFVLTSPKQGHMIVPNDKSSCRLNDHSESCTSKINKIDSNVSRSFESGCNLSSEDNLQVAKQLKVTSPNITNTKMHIDNKTGASSDCDISHDTITSTTENFKEAESRNVTANLPRCESVDKTCAADFQTKLLIPTSNFCNNRLTNRTTCNGRVSQLNDADKDQNLSDKEKRNTTDQNKSDKNPDIETSTCTAIFKKPIGVPPRRKQTRMTKPLGVDVSQDHHIANEIFISDTISCSDVQSEFDCKLLKNATFGRNFLTKPSLPVDKNYLMNKFTNSNTSDIGTPKHQSIPCIKPVYSDVGPGKKSRRYLTNNVVNQVYSVKPLPKHVWLSSRNTNITDIHKSDSEKAIWLKNNQISKFENTMKIKKLKKNCPGCVVPTENGDFESQPMNSRTYNLIIETSGDTCQSHRYIREIERKYIQAMKEIRKNTESSHVKRLKKRKPLLENQSKNGQSDPFCDEKKSKPDESIYDIPSSDSEPQKGHVTPPRSAASTIKSVLSTNPEHLTEKRRQRVPYTEEEINNIITGVKMFGTRWNQILCTYAFHPIRKAVDLSDKYKRMVKKEKEDEQSFKSVSSRHEPFSMCEDRRLVRGVKLYGYSWKTILHSFQFAKCRTSEDLRQRWRSMHKKPGVSKILK